MANQWQHPPINAENEAGQAIARVHLYISSSRRALALKKMRNRLQQSLVVTHELTQ